MDIQEKLTRGGVQFLETSCCLSSSEVTLNILCSVFVLPLSFKTNLLVQQCGYCGEGCALGGDGRGYRDINGNG